MTGLEFEDFCKKYHLEINLDKLDCNTPDLELTYMKYPVCKFYKLPEDFGRWIRFPGKWLSVKNFDKACKCFEKYCRPIIKEIQIKCKLDDIKKDFQ